MAAADASNGLDCSQMWSLVTSQTSNSSATSAHTFYLPTGSLTVSKDITAVDGSSANAFASVSLVQDTFSQVPEPRALAMLLGLGLIAGLGLKKEVAGRSAELVFSILRLVLTRAWRKPGSRFVAEGYFSRSVFTNNRGYSRSLLDEPAGMARSRGIARRELRRGNTSLVHKQFRMQRQQAFRLLLRDLKTL